MLLFLLFLHGNEEYEASQRVLSTPHREETAGLFGTVTRFSRFRFWRDGA